MTEYIVFHEQQMQNAPAVGYVTEQTEKVAVAAWVILETLEAARGKDALQEVAAKHPSVEPRRMVAVRSDQFRPATIKPRQVQEFDVAYDDAGASDGDPPA